MEVKPWQKMVLETLGELSDASFQERAWVRREDGQVSSPSEVVNQLFDDSGLSDLMDNGYAFSEGADSALKELSKHVDTLDFDQDVEDLLSDGGWIKLRELASQALCEVRNALAE